MLDWDDPDKRYYSHGLDRGALYIPGRPPLPWNGLQGFDENTNGSTAMYYRDGVVYLADADAGDFSGQISAIFYPNEFGDCIGIPEATDGFFVDGQKPKQFSLSYRTLVGSGSRGDMFGYQLHLVYGCMATPGTRSRKSLNNSPEPTTFTFDVVCTPVKLPGFRPAAHYVIDTRGMDQSKIDELEALLYDGTDGVLPAPLVFFDIMNYGDALVVTDHGDGTFSVEGSNDNVVRGMDDPVLQDHQFRINNLNSTAPDVNGEYTISDGGTTTVVVG